MDPIITVVSVDGVTTSTSSGLEVTPSNTAGLLQLFHGTDADTAVLIAANGLDFERMIEYCARFGASPDYFWATTRLRIARTYAELNSVVQLDGVPPAVLGFVLPLTVVSRLSSSAPPLVEQWSPEDADYRFNPRAFAAVNAAITNATVTLTSEVQLND